MSSHAHSRPRRFPILAPLAFALLAAAAAAAAEAPAPLDRRIDLDLVDAAANDTFATIARLLDATLTLDQELAARKVTVRLPGVRVSTALDAVCDSLDCRWDLVLGEHPRLRVVARTAGAAQQGPPRRTVAEILDEPISLDLEDAAMGQVLAVFARLLGAKLEADAELAGGTVDISLTEVPLRRALDTVLGGRIEWKVAEDAEGRRLVVRRR